MHINKDLIAILEARAAQAPDRAAFVFLSANGTVSSKITYRVLSTRARSIASFLRTDFMQGERALLAYPSGLEFVEAFFGCLYAGIISVPVHGPRSSKDIPILAAIAADCGARMILSNEESLPLTQQICSPAKMPCDVRAITTKNIAGASGDWQSMPSIDGDALAYLQYTSGSTRQPRGVMVAHNNVLSNLEYIDRGFRHLPTSVSVSWLPHFHDMGLVYGILEPIFMGFLGVLMSPATFVQHPIRWLRAIHDWKATHSGGPNFSYDLCVDRIPEDETAELDLSSWTTAFNGAEPVLRGTIERFTRKFSKNGFRRDGLCPAYGLAEATLKVCSAAGDEGIRYFCADQSALQAHCVRATADDQGRWLASCGSPGEGVQLAIVEPHSRELCRPEQVGEVWVQSASVARGYWNRYDDTKDTFEAYTADGRGPFLRTGDLGFLHDGQLYVTGRLKDLIIVHGKNYYAEDIEVTVRNSSPTLQHTVQVAFGSPTGGGAEGAVIVQELSSSEKSKGLELARIIAEAVLSEHGIQIDRIFFVSRRQIPKTSSGKLRRSTCREAIEKRSMKVVSCVDFASAEQITSRPQELSPDANQAHKLVIERYLLRQVERLRGVSYRGTGKFIAVDSLQAAELARAVARDLEITVSMDRFLKPFSIAEVTEEFARSLRTRTSQPIKDAPGCDAAVLSAEQERLWFLDQIQPGNPALNITAGVFLRGKLDHALLQLSLEKVLEHHQTLRAGFRNSDGVPHLIVAARVDVDLPVLTGPTSFSLERSPSLRANAARDLLRTESLKGFSLDCPPLVACSLVRCVREEYLLIVRIHHIIADATSVDLFIQQLLSTYKSLIDGTALPEISEDIPYFSFTRWQRQNPQLAGPHVDYWRNRLENGFPEFSLPYDRKCADQAVYEAGSVSFDIPADIQQAILTLAEGYKTTPFTVLLSCAFCFLYALTHEEDLMIGVPLNGRNVPGVERTIGLFAFPMPLRVAIKPDFPFATFLVKTHEVALEMYSHSELSFVHLMQIVQPHRSRHLVSPFNLMVTNIKTNISSTQISNLEIGPVLFANGAIDCDLSLMFVDAQDLSAIMTYNAARFYSTTARSMADLFLDVVRKAVTAPETPVGRLFGELPSHRESYKLLISTTFMAEPISESLHFWIDKLQLPYLVEVLPHSQIFQQLLDPFGQFRTNQSGVNVILLRLDDIISGDDGQTSGVECGSARMRFNASDLLTSLEEAVRNSAAQYVLCICPPAAVLLKSEMRCHERLEQLRAAAAQISNLIFLDFEQISSLYPVADCYDLPLEQLSGIPFTRTFFVSLGTALARFIYSVNVPPRKVIVLDCDNTLWRGVCGELGAFGVRVGPPYEALQRFMLGQLEAGMLLCLCSKNEEKDVMSVFDQNPEMVLHRDHLTCWRVNWDSKSHALQSLSSELGFALDSFIFVDDDPLECAEVSLNCPEVMTVQLPAPDDIPTYLQHVWAFDHWRPTREGRLRAVTYEQNRKREQLRAAAPSLEDFLIGLQIKTRIASATIEDVPRMWELIQRTTQFNTSLKRRATNEIRLLLQSGYYRCHTVTLSDRYGEYGLIGLIIFTLGSSMLEVDTFLLSCRVLGRRVEHQMLAWLGKEAVRLGLSHVRLAFRHGVRNRPAYEFLKALAADEFLNTEQNELVFTMSAHAASQLPQLVTCE